MYYYGVDAAPTSAPRPLYRSTGDTYLELNIAEDMLFSCQVAVFINCQAKQDVEYHLT